MPGVLHRSSPFALRLALLALHSSLLALLLCLPACSRSDSPPVSDGVVVVFTALDRVYSDPILQDFQRRTGITVQPVFDAEAAKTTGLVNRLIARREHPECDVLWNNESLQTEQLAQMGLLAPYTSPNAARIPPAYRDPQARWTGFAGRLRLLIYNTQRLPGPQRPTGLAAFTDPRYRGQATLARPFFGTTLTHLVALRQDWGDQRFGAFLQALRANDVALAPGNGAVRDLVASGERAFGLTDTDDAYEAMQAGKPVSVAVPDAEEGALLIPNTVALVAGCPHPRAGRLLIDYLLSPEVERRLAQGPSAQIPLGTDLPDVKTPWDDLRRGKVRVLDLMQAAAAKNHVIELLQQARMDE